MRISQTVLPPWVYKKSMPDVDIDYLESDLAPTVKRAVCAPTAAANIILYHSSHGKRSLVEPMGSQDRDTFVTKLIDRLAKLMHTSRVGTNFVDFTVGLEQYYIDRGYDLDILPYTSEKPPKGEEFAPVTQDAVYSSIIGNRDSILWVGNYKYRPIKKVYERVGGHAVTMAGFNRKYNELFFHNRCAGAFKRPQLWRVETFEGNVKADSGTNFLDPLIIREEYEQVDRKNLQIVEYVICLEAKR